MVWRTFAIVSANRQLVALDIADGRVAWTLDVPLHRWRESGDLLFGIKYADVWGKNGGVGADDLETRSLRFVQDDSSFAPTPPPLPNFELWGAGTIAAGDEILMVNYWRRRLWGLDAVTGRPRWMHSPPGGVTGICPVLSGDRLIVQGPGLCCYQRGST